MKPNGTRTVNTVQQAMIEVAGLPPADWDSVIIATGPLTSAPLADAVRRLTGEDALAFFDGVGMIVFFTVGEDECRAWPVAKGAIIGAADEATIGAAELVTLEVAGVA